MANLAISYIAHGRLQDAVRMQEEVLQINSRVLPANHEDIGESDLWPVATLFVLTRCRHGHNESCRELLRAWKVP